MPLRTGIDVVELERFEVLLEKHGSALTTEFFTAEEQRFADASNRPSVCYATYWALREAAYKVGEGSLWNHYSVRPGDKQFELLVDPGLYDSENGRVPEQARWDSSLTEGEDEIIASVFASWSLDLT